MYVHLFNFSIVLADKLLSMVRSVSEDTLYDTIEFNEFLQVRLSIIFYLLSMVRSVSEDTLYDTIEFNEFLQVRFSFIFYL